MTIVAFQTDPIVNFNSYYLNDYVILLYIWIGEVLAYIILAKIEEIALKSKYGNAYLNYMYNVPFMLPFLSLKRREYKNLES
jgi:protein-S-isoprenylcysteine O-methyltransferase Ste14